MVKKNINRLKKNFQNQIRSNFIFSNSFTRNKNYDLHNFIRKNFNYLKKYFENKYSISFHGMYPIDNFDYAYMYNNITKLKNIVNEIKNEKNNISFKYNVDLLFEKYCSKKKYDYILKKKKLNHDDSSKEFCPMCFETKKVFENIKKIYQKYEGYEFGLVTDKEKNDAEEKIKCFSYICLKIKSNTFGYEQMVIFNFKISFSHKKNLPLICKKGKILQSYSKITLKLFKEINRGTVGKLKWIYKIINMWKYYVNEIGIKSFENWNWLTEIENDNKKEFINFFEEKLFNLDRNELTKLKNAFLSYLVLYIYDNDCFDEYIKNIFDDYRYVFANIKNEFIKIKGDKYFSLHKKTNYSPGLEKIISLNTKKSNELYNRLSIRNMQNPLNEIFVNYNSLLMIFYEFAKTYIDKNINKEIDKNYLSNRGIIKANFDPNIFYYPIWRTLNFNNFEYMSTFTNYINYEYFLKLDKKNNNEINQVYIYPNKEILSSDIIFVLQITFLTLKE